MMTTPVRMLIVASLVLVFSHSTLRAAPSPELQSVVGFCKAHITVYDPPAKGPWSSDQGGVPTEL